MGYEFTWHARSSSIDETNHLYYPKLFEHIDNGIEALLEAIDHPLFELIPHEGHALPIVHVEANYLAPITFGDTVACTLSPEVGDASIRFHATGTVDGQRVFEATVVRVLVDMDSFEKRSLPTELRTAVTRFADP